MRKHAKIVFKEFGSSFGRFIAITGIIALGVAILMGLSFVTPDMKTTMTNYFDESGYYDFTVAPSNLDMSGDDLIGMMGELDKLLTDEDIDNIKSEIEGAEITPVVSFDAFYTLGDDVTNHTVKLVATGDGNPAVNSLTIVDGRLPSSDAEGEVVAIVPFADGMIDIKAGDKLTYSDSNGALNNALFTDSAKELTVTGIATSPLYFTKSTESCSIGSGTLDIILYGSSDMYLLNNLMNKTYYTELWINAGGNAYTAFTEEYDSFASDMQKRIELIGTDEGNDVSNWYVLGRKVNSSYYSMSINIDKVAQIAGIFPVFFILIAALVAFSTIVRMVDEDRGQLGTLRSLGYNSSQIVGKYIFYSVAASLLGCAISVPFGAFLLPVILWNAYGSMYTLPALTFTADWLFCVIAFVGTVAATILVTVFACYSSLKETPASILQPRAPKPGKRILLERTPIWKRLSFKFKAMFRNIFRFKRNLLMTVLSVAGCSALILAGFGLLNTMTAVGDLQYGDVFKYDIEIGVTADYTESADYAELESLIEGSERITIMSGMGTLYSESSSDTINIITAKADEISDFITIEGTYDENSVIISKGLSQAYGIKVGDKIDVRLSTGERAELSVTGITTVYSECWLFLGENMYSQFGDLSYSPNTLLIKKDIAESDYDTVKQTLFGLDCVTGVSFSADEKEYFENITSTIGLVTLVLVIAAGLLVVIVLYNLTNINICERRKEIATLKVLGYRRREVSGYVFREILTLVVFGVIIGVPLGMGLLYFIITQIMSSFMTFPFIISWWSYVSTIALTFGFTGLVDLLLLPKLNRINMADSMKAVD